MANKIQRFVENWRLKRLDAAEANVTKYGEGTVGGDAAAGKAKKLTRKLEGKPPKN
jgi:hypothetical protein